jgi:hypothetical protein
VPPALHIRILGRVALLDIHSSSEEAEQRPRAEAANAKVLKRMLGYGRSMH